MNTKAGTYSLKDLSTFAESGRRKGVRKMASNGKQDDMIVIHKTNNYDMFKTIPGNRAINMAHVNLLIVSIGKKNLLRFNPILVNEKKQVVDGQHRLAAAKANSWDIYYRVEPGLSLEDVQLLNANTRPWTLLNYLESYMSQGVREYQVLHDFRTEYGISLSLAMHMLLNKAKLEKVDYRTFRNGEFAVTNYAKGEEMLMRIMFMKEFTHGDVWQHREFIRAYFNMLEKIPFKQFAERAKAAAMKIERRANQKDYLRQLEDIANFGMRTNQVRLY